MADMERIALLLRQIVSTGRISGTDNPFAHPEYASWIQEQSGDWAYEVFLNAEGLEDLIALMRTLRDDERIAQHVEYDDLFAATRLTLLLSAEAFDSATLDEHAQAQELYRKLTVGVVEWHITVTVPGLRMAAGDVVSIAGLQFGMLTDEERDYIRQTVEQAGGRPRLTPQGAPGTALSHMMESTEKLLTGNGPDDCWAWGTVEATEASLERVVDERINVVALNVMRCFALRNRQGPDHVSLGEPSALQVRRRLRYRVDNPAETFVGGYSRFTDRIPFVLSRPFLEHLQTYPAWQRAIAIVDPSRQRSDFEETVFKAMLQFGTTSTLQPLEAKLAGYLSALEVLLLGDDDYSNHDVKIGRRLSALIDGDMREFIADIYHARQGPVHRAERNVDGKVVVLEDEVRHLCHFLYEAIMAALDRSATNVNRQQMLDELDAQVEEPQEDWPKYSFVVHTVLDGQEYEAVCPDFPNCRGRGRTPKEAQERARIAVDARVRKLLEVGERPPAVRATEVNRLPVWAPANEDQIAEYLTRATELEEREHKRLLHIAGGTMSAQDAADHLSITVDDLDARRSAGHIIGLPVNDGFVYPVCQFDDGGTLPGLAAVLQAFNTNNPWTQAAFLHTRLPRNTTILQELRLGHLDDALHEARLLREQGEAWFRVVR